MQSKINRLRFAETLFYKKWTKTKVQPVNNFRIHILQTTFLHSCPIDLVTAGRVEVGSGRERGR